MTGGRGRVRGRGRGRVRGGSVAGENRSIPSTSTPIRPSELPVQYNFTPAPELSPPRRVLLTQCQLHVRHFPPPTQLFNNSSTRPPHSSQSEGPPLNPQPQMPSCSSPGQGLMSPPPRYSNLPLQNSEAQSNQASEAQHSNELEEDRIDGIDDNAEIQPNLQEDQLRYLESLLRMPAVISGQLSSLHYDLKTHTKPDGTYVDRKAQKIAETYEKSLQAKLSEFEAETSDGTSRPRELTTDEYNDLFIQSTIVDGRGHAYGIGSLGESHVTGKRKYSGSSSSSYHLLQQQLEEAKRQIEAHSAQNAKLEAELARQAAEQHDLSIMEKYLRKTDPRYLDFCASQSDPTHTSP